MNDRKIVPIVLSTDKNYVAQLYVCLASLVKHITEEYFYHIYVLHTEIEEYTEWIFKRGLRRNNVEVEFRNVKDEIAPYRLKEKGNWTRAVYYRLLIPDLFQEYEKVIYLDADLLVCHDIADLFETAFKEDNTYLAAAADDINIVGKKTCVYSQYLTEELGLDMDSYPVYFNSGVMVFHISNIREQFSVKDLLKLAEKDYLFLDQDILNRSFAGKIQWLSICWNCFNIWEDEQYQDRVQKEFQVAKSYPYIIHYVWGKPWKKSVPFAELWWDMARQTPYYESLLKEYLYPDFLQRVTESFGFIKRKCQLEQLRNISKKIFVGGGIRKFAIKVYEWKLKRLEAKEKN